MKGQAEVKPGFRMKISVSQSSLKWPWSSVLPDHRRLRQRNHSHHSCPAPVWQTRKTGCYNCQIYVEGLINRTSFLVCLLSTPWIVNPNIWSWSSPEVRHWGVGAYNAWLNQDNSQKLDHLKFVLYNESAVTIMEAWIAFQYRISRRHNGVFSITFRVTLPTPIKQQIAYSLVSLMNIAQDASN